MMVKSKRAEMGIGTLIIFIAMLLVAAVAAGVVIQTNSSLQEKALSTGDQAKSQISTNIRVIEVSGSDGSDGAFDTFNQIVKLSPGSDAVKLEQVLVTLNTYNTTSTLTYRGTDANHTLNASGGFYTYSNGTGFFTAEYLQRGSNPVDGNLQRGDIIKLYFASPRNITEDEQVRINFIPKIGTPTLTEFIVPEVVSTQRVYLYP